MSKMTDKQIIYYDSDCLMCSQFIQFVLRFEKNDTFRFCSLSRINEFENISVTGNSLVLKTKAACFFESRAVFSIIKQLKFPANLLAIGTIFPTALSDKIYRVVANNRSKIMAKSACPIWSDDEKKKFL